MKIKRLELKKLNNTRDLGGLPTKEGRVIAHGKLLRSGRLYKLPKRTVARLKDKGLATVVDLRLDVERTEHPDTVIDDCNYYWLPLLCTATAGITREESMRKTMLVESRRIEQEFGNADNYMVEMYKSILLSEHSKTVLKDFLKLVYEEESCILWHCSGGKDRAGICAMLVEALLGVADEVIISDYVATREFVRAHNFWRKLALRILPISKHFRAILFGMMDAKKTYITQIINYVNGKFGSIVDYCKQVLNVTDENIALMRAKYLQ